MISQFCPKRVRIYGFKTISGKDFERVWENSPDKTKAKKDLVNEIFIFACIIPFYL